MSFSSIHPATGEVLQTYSPMSLPQAQEILQLAQQTFRKWKDVEVNHRCQLLLQAAAALSARKKEFALLMSQEMGKPITQAEAEIEKCAWCCKHYAQTAAQFLQSIPITTDAQKSLVAFRPLGVILGIMPWNFPFWQVFRFAVPTLAAGNTIALKHAQNVSGCSLAIEAVFREAGFPENAFRSLLVDSAAASRLIQEPSVAAVTITGSVGAGRAVATEAGKALKKCVLELGGSDPFLVLEDADLETAAAVGVQARFQNTGQSCIAAKRFILVEKIRDAFEKRFVEKALALKLGNPGDAGTELGPLARRDLRDQLHEQVQKSVAAGARVLCGGKVPAGPGAFYPATVLTDVKPGTPAWSEELFGPVAACIPVKDEDEAVEVANGTEFGLGGSVWTRDSARGEKLATERIHAGSCFVNAMVKSDPRLPFGGIKHSGYGRELGEFGIHEFVNIKTVVVQN